jgi:hypothetical protein
MKVRVQFAMDSDLKLLATERAHASGLSFGEYVVKLVEEDLDRPKSKTGIEAIFNLGSSGGSDIAHNKDSMIAEALESMHRRILQPRSAHAK